MAALQLSGLASLLGVEEWATVGHMGESMRQLELVGQPHVQDMLYFFRETSGLPSKEDGTPTSTWFPTCIL